MSDVDVRRAGPADLPACAALQALHSGGSTDAIEQRLRRELDRADRTLFVARADGAVLGYGRLTRFTSGGAAREAPTGTYLGGLVVAPPHRGCGVGTALTVARMRAAFETRDTDAVWYVANARNQASIALHERLAFREVTRDFWYPGVTFEGGVGVLFRADAPTP